MSDQETTGTPSETSAAPAQDADLTQLAAQRTLRRTMFNPRASAATQMRAAQILLEQGLRAAAIADEKAQLARLEELDPQKAALGRLSDDELRRLQEFTLDRDEGIDLNPQQIALAKKFAGLEQEIRADKLRRLAKR